MSNIYPGYPNGPAPQYAPNPFPLPPGAQPVPAYTPPPMGCICPPGANKDCENPACPRQNHNKKTVQGL